MKIDHTPGTFQSGSPGIKGTEHTWIVREGQRVSDHGANRLSKNSIT